MSTIAVRARGEAVRLAREAIAGPGKFRMLLLKASQTDTLLQKHQTVADMLAASGNTECDATNYVRKQLTVAVATDTTTNDEQYVTLTSVTFTSLGGATNNTITEVVVYWDPTGSAADNACIPVGYWTTSFTTSGVNLVIAGPANGFLGGT